MSLIKLRYFWRNLKNWFN